MDNNEDFDLYEDNRLIDPRTSSRERALSDSELIHDSSKNVNGTPTQTSEFAR